MGGEMKKEYLTKIRSRYNKGGKGEKTAILDEFCAPGAPPGAGPK